MFVEWDVVCEAQRWRNWSEFQTRCSGADCAAAEFEDGAWSAFDISPAFFVFETLAGRWRGEVLKLNERWHGVRLILGLINGGEVGVCLVSDGRENLASGYRCRWKYIEVEKKMACVGKTTWRKGGLLRKLKSGGCGS